MSHKIDARSFNTLPTNLIQHYICIILYIYYNIVYIIIQYIYGANVKINIYIIEQNSDSRLTPMCVRSIDF